MAAGKNQTYTQDDITYYHPVLFLCLSAWLNDECFVDVFITINGHFSSSKERDANQRSLLAHNTLIHVSSQTIDPMVSILYYNSLEFVVEAKRVDILNFCRRYVPNQRFEHFERSKKHMYEYMKTVLGYPPTLEDKFSYYNDTITGQFAHLLVFWSFLFWTNNRQLFNLTPFVFFYCQQPTFKLDCSKLYSTIDQQSS